MIQSVSDQEWFYGKKNHKNRISCLPAAASAAVAANPESEMGPLASTRQHRVSNGAVQNRIRHS